MVVAVCSSWCKVVLASLKLAPGLNSTFQASENKEELVLLFSGAYENSSAPSPSPLSICERSTLLLVSLEAVYVFLFGSPVAHNNNIIGNKIQMSLKTLCSLPALRFLYLLGSLSGQAIGS